MNKPFRTYSEQLQLLVDRNVTISDTETALKMLRTLGYYNVVNGYKDIFIDRVATQQHGSDYYKDGTTFEQMCSLYRFDFLIRNILMGYLLMAETTLKTKCSYIFSENCSSNFSYLDINNFNLDNPQDVTKLISKLSNVLTVNTSPTGQISHYIKNHRTVPLWVLSQKMTFGEIKHFISSLKIDMLHALCAELMADYAQEYGATLPKLTPSTTVCISYMLDFLNDYRNTCAHNERLYNKVYKKYGKIPPITLFHIPEARKFNSKFYDCVLTLRLLLPKHDYITLTDNIKREIHHLEKVLLPTQFSLVVMFMGFSKQWQDDLSLLAETDGE